MTVRIEAMWRVSVDWYGDRLVDADYRPASVDHLQDLLTEAGMTGEFWQLA